MSNHEIDPMSLARRDTTPKLAFNETEPSHEEKIEMLYPRAIEMVKMHRHRVVPRVEEALEKYGNYARFPKDVVEDLANNVYTSGETEMIEAIAMALQRQKEK